MTIVKIDVINSPSARRKRANHPAPDGGRKNAINLSKIETSHTDRKNSFAPPRNQAE